MNAKPILLGLYACCLCGCITQEFEVPETEATTVTPTGTEIALNAVLNSLRQSSEPVVSFEATDTYFTGYVISSDVAGNFYHELLLQDAPENPSSGITLQLNENALYTTYEPGRKVYVYGLEMAMASPIFRAVLSTVTLCGTLK